MPALQVDTSDGVTRPRRLALIAGMALAVCVIAIAAGALWHEREEKLVRVQRDLTNLSLALAEHVARTLETIDLGLAAGLGQLRDASGAAELDQRALRVHADTIPAVSAIALYGADGVRRAASIADDSALPYSLDRNDILAAREQPHGLSVSSRRTGAHGGWTLFVVRGIVAPQAEFSGVIAAAIDARRLAESYKAITLGESGTVGLYSTRGVLLASHPWRDDLIGQAHFAASAVGAFEEPSAAVHQFVSPFTNQLAIGANIRIRGYPLILNLTVDQSAVLAPWRRQALVVGVAAAIITALIAAFVARGTLIGITERKRVAAAQRQSDERLRTITANIPGIVFEYRLHPDHSATFEYLSDRALDVLEESPQALMRNPRLIFDMVDPAYRRRLLRSMRASRDHLTLWTLELPIRTKSGRVKWMRGQSVPKPLDDGSVMWDGVIVDVSAQKQAEQAIKTLNEHLERRVAERTAELSAAYRDLEAFSYSVSHDLRAPLRSIDGFSRILQEEYGAGLDAGAAELLARVRAAAQRMGQLIDDLLSLSRVTRSELKRVRTDLSAMAQGIMTELAADSPQRIVDLRIEPGVVGFADPNLLRIALYNLLGNAWKFSSKRECARIEFGILLNGEKTVYYVRDNGAGFDMKYAGKLFGAFQRVHSSREFDGTGIGLATVSRIIDRHGGAVWAQAEVNQGATFYFTLTGSEQR